MKRTMRRFWMALGLGCLGSVASNALAEPPADVLRRVSVDWERRGGPERRVVDQVCLVPDLPTFLEAISTWDRDHWFPILIDDVELTFKFLRAFRPARIVRYPKKVGSLPANQVWDRATAAVGRSWAEPGAADDAVELGNAPPRGAGATPPGVVVSSPESPMLAGAVALAAGRFQPLVRWDVPKRFADVIGPDEARGLALDLETRVAQLVPSYGKLGDDCDFLTLAGDWPYRYREKEGEQALDDLLGRFLDNRARWAFVGRLVGGESASVYQAMCSLFLQPRSGLLFNTYPEAGEPWSGFSMRGASERLGAVLPVEHRSGVRAGLAGWHEDLDPINRFGLVLINTQGGPAQFALSGGNGVTADVPPSVPAIVLMIHSYSAADPSDPQTIAGRWLAGGAYVYFGSMNEPYLQSFQTPGQVAGLIAEGIPLGALMRKSLPEPFGQPWRLLYLGDPLYRVRSDDRPRLDAWAPVASWPQYAEAASPGAGASDDARLTWALKVAIARLRRDPGPARRSDLSAGLLAIDRERLAPPLRLIRDALVIDALLQAGRLDDLRVSLAQIPNAEQSPSVRRHWEGSLMAVLQRLAAARDLDGAEALWSDAIRSTAPRAFLEQVTARVGALADSPTRRADWDARLRAALRGLEGTPGAEVIQAERKRIGDQGSSSSGQP